MATYPVSGSTLGSNISTGLSTQIIVRVGTITVGAIQNLAISQTRSLYRSREIGLDGILEIVPNNATEYTANITRIVFDRLRLLEAFGRGFINIKSQLIPFTIDIIDRSGGNEESGAVVHRLVNCWFATYNPRYEASNFIISEEATIQFEDISTTLSGSAEPAAQGGERGLVFSTNARERAADAGDFRGTMDVSNLINIIDQAFE